MTALGIARILPIEVRHPGWWPVHQEAWRQDALAQRKPYRDPLCPVCQEMALKAKK